MYCVFHLAEQGTMITAVSLANGFTVCKSCSQQIYSIWKNNPSYTFLEVVAKIQT